MSGKVSAIHALLSKLPLPYLVQCNALILKTVYREILARFIFALFSLWSKGKFKTQRIIYKGLNKNIG